MPKAELRRAGLWILAGSILVGALAGAVTAVIEDHRHTKTLLTPKE